jgi:hypothetical protein
MIGFPSHLKANLKQVYQLLLFFLHHMLFPIQVILDTIYLQFASLSYIFSTRGIFGILDLVLPDHNMCT